MFCIAWLCWLHLQTNRMPFCGFLIHFIWRNVNYGLIGLFFIKYKRCSFLWKYIKIKFVKKPRYCSHGIYFTYTLNFVYNIRNDHTTCNFHERKQMWKIGKEKWLWHELFPQQVQIMLDVLLVSLFGWNAQ